MMFLALPMEVNWVPVRSLSPKIPDLVKVKQTMQKKLFNGQRAQLMFCVVLAG